MKKSNRRIPVVTFFSLVLQLGACVMNAPLPVDHYAGTDKIAGGNPPSAPVVTFNKAQLRVDFTASIDPETAAEVSTYFFYFYNGVPQTYYQIRDIAKKIDSPSVRGFNLNTPSEGKHTLVVTGFDGYRESAISDQNRIIFDWP